MMAPDMALNQFDPNAINYFQPPTGGQPMGLQQFGLPPQLTNQFSMDQEDPFAKMSADATRHIRSARPGADLMESDLEQFASLDNIKQAARGKTPGYPSANPYRELLEVKAALEKDAAALNETKDRVEFLKQAALADFSHQVRQHLMNGGNLGEVVHALSACAEDGYVKEAMQYLVPDLQRHRFNMPRVQAELIQYEMEKGASVRALNPESPIVQSFAAIVSTSQELEHTEKTAAEANRLLAETMEVLGRAELTRV
jgi:hypothetical protein